MNMYNRYIRNESGSYTRIPQEESHAAQTFSEKHRSASQTPLQESEPKTSIREEHHSSSSARSGSITDGLTSFLRHILDQLHLDHVDTGDLLLLGLLFFLFREDADEELLVALGLLLIL